jgi:osmotically-inducible protein OsmY
MKQLLGLVAAACGAAVTMYYFDPDMGRRRRALLRGRLVGLSHDAQRELRGEMRYAADRAKGVLATGRLDGISETPPASDAQLRDRVRSRLGRLVSHPGAIEVQVEDGIVRLSGDVLVQELDGLLTQVRDMAGAKRVFNALTAHESPQGIAAAQGGAETTNEELVEGHPS